MLRFIVIVIAINCISFATADEETETLEKIYQMAQHVVNTTAELQQKYNSFEARKGGLGLSPLHFLFPLWGFGGLNAFAIFIAVKIKIILIVVAVGFGIFYYTKFLALKKKFELSKYGKYSGFPSGIREGGLFESPFPMGGHGYPTGYSNHLDIANFDAINPFLDIHSDIDQLDYGHHIHYDHDHGHDHFHDHSHDHEHEHDHHDHGEILSEAPTYPAPTYPAPTYPAPSENPTPSMSPNRRRVGRQRRGASEVTQQIEFFDLGELAFRFLGVHTDGCRRRFVCELDFRARTNPVTRLAFSFIGRNFFEQYRNVESIDETPKRFGDCARMFNDCKDAEKYNNNDDTDDEEYDDREPITDYTDVTSTSLDVTESVAMTETSTLDQYSANEMRHMSRFNDDVAQYVHLNRNKMQ